MTIRPRAVVIASAIVAVAVFCGVQEHLTIQGEERYVELQSTALAGRGPAVTIDEIMRPAVAHSVRQGVFWGAAVMGSGLGVAGVLARRRRSS